MKIFLYIIIGLIVLWLIGGALYTHIVGSKKKRLRVIFTLYLSFSDDAKAMLSDVFKLHQQKKNDEVNQMVEQASNTTQEIMGALIPENRPIILSSGKQMDMTTWQAYKTRFTESGYSEVAAKFLAGIYLFEFDDFLTKFNSNSTKIH